MTISSFRSRAAFKRPVSLAAASLLLFSAASFAAWLPPQTRHVLLAPLAHLTAAPAPAARVQLATYRSGRVIRPRAVVTLTVNSTGDADDATPEDGVCQTTSANGAVCTLRAAIEQANADGGDTINFAIPGAGVHTITPATALPPITATTTVDVTTQPGSIKNTSATGSLNAAPQIVLNGNSNPSIARGLDVRAANCKISGLVVQNFTAHDPNVNVSGILLESGASGSQIAGCFFGTDAAGTTAQSNDSDIDIEGGNNYKIGGLNAADRNLMFGGGIYGALVTNGATGNAGTPSLIMQGNLVGLTKAGGAAPGTTRALSLNNAPFVIIGGTTPATRNVVSASSGNGLIALNNGSSNATIQGNYFDTDATGTTGVGSAALQIYTSDNLLGGAVAGAGNVFSGNGVICSIPSGNNTVQGNTFGLNAAGTAPLANNNAGLILSGSSGNTVGGTTASARNIFAVKNGLGDGAIGLTASSNNTIQGNYVGVNAAGNAIFPTGTFGKGVTIKNGSTNNVIGGIIAGAGNVFSGSNETGLSLQSDSNNNTIQGNKVGTNAAGTVAVANQGSAIVISSSSGNLIGGTAALASNVIASGDYGISLSGDSNTIQGNFIGVGADGVSALPNARAGIDIVSSNNLIGGTVSGAGNVIAFNGKFYGGVYVEGGTGNAILGNSIHDNGIGATGTGGLGIDLGANGVTPNDVGDADSGPNGLQNFPVITGVVGNVISGTLNAAPTGTGESYRIELFSSAAPDPSGYGEGETFLGFVSVPTDASGNASWSFTSPVSLAGRAITATATYISTTASVGAAELAVNGDTSEFSKVFAVGSTTPTPTPTATATPKPTATPAPTATPVPTATPKPTATATPTPTGVPVPTATPKPTATPAPTKAATSTALASSLNPSNFGQSVTFTATISASSINQGVKPRQLGAAPTGGVAFFDGANTVGTGTLSNGSATFSTSGLGVGTHAITAKYVGDASYNGSISNTVSQVVNGAPVLTLTQSTSAPSVGIGGPVTFSIVVKNTGTGAAPAVVAFNTLPANATFVSASGGVFTKNGQTLTFTLGALGVGASQTLTVTVTAPTSVGTLVNSVTASATGPNGPQTAPVPAQVQVINGAPAYTFAVGKLINVGPYSPTLYHPGGHLVQTVTVTNTGSASASGPLQLVFDGLPSSVTLLNANGTASNGAPFVTVPLVSGTLGVGGSVSLRLEFRLKRSDKPTFAPRITTGNGAT